MIYSFLKSKYVILSILVLLVAGVSIIFIMKKESPKDFYLRAEKKNYIKYSEKINEFFENFYDNQKVYLENMYKKRYDVTASINSPDASAYGFQKSYLLDSFVKKCRLIVDYNNDIKNDKTLTKMSLLVQKTPILDSEIFTDKNIIGLNIPVILPEREFVFDKKNLDNIYKSFNIPITPKRIIGPVEMARTLKYKKEDLDAVSETYGNLLVDAFRQSEVSLGKESSVSINGKQVKVNEVTVTLDRTKTNKLFKELLNTIANDNTVISLTYQNITEMVELLDDSSIFEIFNILDREYIHFSDDTKQVINALKIKKDLQGFKNYLKDIAGRLDFKDGLEMKLLIDKSNNIIERKLSLGYVNEKNLKREFSIDNLVTDLNNEGFENMQTNFEFGINDGTKNNIYIVGYRSLYENRGKRKVNLSYGKKIDREAVLNANLKLEMNGEELEQKDSNSGVVYDLKIKTKNSVEQDVFKGNIDTTSKWNEKFSEMSYKSKFQLEADIPSLNLKKTNIELNIKSLNKMYSDFEINKHNELRTVELDKLDEQKLGEINLEIYQSLMSFYLENKPLIDS